MSKLNNVVNKLYSHYDLVVLKGPGLPPIGGVSIYLKRSKAVMDRLGQKYSHWETNLNSFVYYRKFLQLLLSNLQDKIIVHLHSVRNKHIILLLFLSYIRSIDIAFTHHNVWAISKKFKLKRMLLKLLNRRAVSIFYVNIDTPDFYIKMGVDLHPNATLCSPFVPPPSEDRELIEQSYPPTLHEFIKEKEPLLITAAHKIVFQDDIDLYGLDMVVKALIETKKDFSNIGLIVALADDTSHNSYIKSLKSMITDSNLKLHVFWLTPQYQIWPLFSKCDVYLRPTLTDGHGVAIDEAIHEGCSVLTSDVCKRNSKAHIFRSRNLEDFIFKLKHILKEKES